MSAETIRARFDRRAERRSPRRLLVWPALAGCALWTLDLLIRATFWRHLYLTCATCLSLLLLLGLAPWALWAMLLALSERPPLRRRALLANGGFLLLLIASAIYATAF